MGGNRVLDFYIQPCQVYPLSLELNLGYVKSLETRHCTRNYHHYVGSLPRICHYVCQLPVRG